ncbi:MAG: hypothetical protein H6721_12535 [Sandaracinus sp.]|nr:hypothetical protein [Sandaracinus sp.]MCB9622672.1 hypothetical protein [Sandaracinus sp.]MCB9632946.1 hypothetical protein [Sandaracinus sp.]
MRYGSGAGSGLEVTAFVGDAWPRLLDAVDAIGAQVAAGDVGVEDVGVLVSAGVTAYAMTGVQCPQCDRWIVFDPAGKVVGFWERVSEGE